jgi:hypothetical protein
MAISTLRKEISEFKKHLKVADQSSENETSEDKAPEGEAPEDKTPEEMLPTHQAPKATPLESDKRPDRPFHGDRETSAGDSTAKTPSAGAQGVAGHTDETSHQLHTDPGVSKELQHLVEVWSRLHGFRAFFPDEIASLMERNDLKLENGQKLKITSIKSAEHNVEEMLRKAKGKVIQGKIIASRKHYQHPCITYQLIRKEDKHWLQIDYYVDE